MSFRAWAFGVMILAGFLGVSDAFAGAVVGRHLFYNNSEWDEVSDDEAIAVDKQALLPGMVATSNHYTNCVQGLNGVMIDIDGAGGGIGLSDLVLRVGNSLNALEWTTYADSATVTVDAGTGTGGSDRVKVVFPDQAIQDQWLQVTVLVTPATQLTGGADVFYFGNLRGDVTGDFQVTPIDDLTIVNYVNAHGPAAAAIDAPLDVNRDALVSSLDALAVTSIINNTAGVGTPALAQIPEPGTIGLLTLGGVALLGWRRR